MAVILYKSGCGSQYYGWVTDGMYGREMVQRWNKEEPGFYVVGRFTSEDAARTYCRQNSLPLDPLLLNPS